MNTPNCTTCEDTGHSSPDIFDLDCTDCDVASQRYALNKFASDARRKSPDVGDLYWAIHQRALAICMSASVEDTLNEMQPGGALHMPQEPVAHLKFWASQSWSGNGNHDIDCGEGLEVCEPGEIGADGLPAFPVFLHAIPGSLAMAPKQEALAESLPEMTDDLIFQWAEGYVFITKGMPHKMTFTRPRFVEAVRTIIAHLPKSGAAPAAANGALTDEAIYDISAACEIGIGHDDDDTKKRIDFARAILAAARGAA